MASESAPMPPRTKPTSRDGGHAAHYMMHQDVGVPGERGPPLAPITHRCERDFQLRRFEPFVEQLRRALGEIFTSATISAGPFAEARGESEVFDQVTGAAGGNCGGVVNSSPSTICARRASCCSKAG